MPRKHRDVRSGVESKGFAVDQQRHHIVLVYKDLEGRTTTARTLISHGAGGNEFRDALLGQMARQVGLTRVDFRRLVDCPMSRKEFDTVIAKRDN